MSINLDEITRALAEATPGPWEVGYDERSPSKDGMFWWIHCPKGSLGYMPKPDVDDDNYVRFTKEDAHLIAHAPEWLRLLVERVGNIESVAREVWDNASGDVTGKMIVKGSAMMKLLDILDDAKEST